MDAWNASLASVSNGCCFECPGKTQGHEAPATMTICRRASVIHVHVLGCASLAGVL